MASTSKKNILIVDDQKRIRDILANILEKKGYQPFLAENGQDALRMIRETPMNMVLLDLMMPQMNGLEVMAEIRRIDPALPVVMITAYGSIPTAVEAIKQGAYDFVEKPLDADKILVVIKNALEKYALSQENLRLRENILERYRIVGGSAAIQKVLERLSMLASKECTVLITGESGTGKELVARTLHARSSRVAGPFVKVNCAALPQELIESELFGYKKGAFTGAYRDTAGKFEAANGGTLFLDEIGELPLAMQAKLLQVLEDKRFYRVGDAREVVVDVRLIAATNRELEKEIEENRFRPDLFYRLNITHIHIPPLRERPEDIPDLCQHFLTVLCEEMNLPPRSISPDAIHLFLEYPWPGNARELRNKLNEILIFHQGDIINPDDVLEYLEIQPSNYPANDQTSPTSLRSARENFEREYIRKALIAHDWNMPAAAEYLGIERTNLYRKMRQLGVGK